MRPLVRTGLPWALAAALFCAASVHAAVALRDATELTRALKSEAPCCVIDARGQDHQRQHPLVDALRYRPGLNIIPSASVIVVADRDQDAVKVATVLAQQHPGKVIYAVKGGLLAWQSVLKTLAKASSSKVPGAVAGISFVIPHNTCETGTPLQVLTSKPKP